MKYRSEPGENATGRLLRPTTWTSRAATVGMIVTASAVCFAACSGENADEPRRGGDVVEGGGGGEAGAAGASNDGGNGGTTGTGVACIEGSKKDCSIYIGENNGVITCFHGVQVCTDGAWGTCTDGKMTLIPKSEHPAEKPGGPSDFLTDCVNNPCDPSCQMFDETPDGGLTPASQTPIFSWETGDLGDYPPGLAKKGLNEPCSTGLDCQFNEYCSAPVSGTCEHNKCAVGEALTSGCDTCVNEVCAIDASCCKTTYGGTCEHDYCDTGNILANGCDTCVNQICAADPTCCDTGNKGACSHTYCATGSSLANGCDPCVSTVCAQDPKCCNLSTTGTCSHGYCSTGDALEASCHSCVADICATDPKCCDDTPGTTTCQHDYCKSGKKLDPNCDPCVAAVCAVRPQCCTSNSNSAWNSTCRNLVATQCQPNDRCPSPKWSQSCANKVASVCGNSCSSGWDQRCVDKTASMCGKDCAWDQSCADKVSTVCGKSCGPFQWDADCVDKVDTVCAATCYQDPPCSHNKCDSGGPLDPACDTCVASICQELPFCCTDGWTNLCVDRVKTKCNQGCQTQGDCVPWLPGQTDPTCPGYDLSVGIPCGTSVPVCNHGKTTVPAGVKVVHFPANSQQYPLCTPDQTHPQMQSCFTTAPIAPGKCINLPAASCNLGNGNREIMVNPPSFAGYTQLPECTCKDNWSLWSGPGVSCEPPSCSNTTTTTVTRVNMFIALDRSGSMGSNIGGGETRWTATIKALKSFVKDPASANLGVALRFWPDNSPVSGCNDSSCSTNACKAPLVNVGLLTLQSAPADTQEQLLLNALSSKSPSGSTPMSAALAGATQWAIEYKAAHPQEEAIVVFATDGEPTTCSTNSNTISNYAGNAFTNSGIKTYAIGLQDAPPALMNLIASKGGTDSAFFIAPGGNVEYELLSALVQIKGNTQACDFTVPQGGVYDPSAAKIVLTPTSGMPVILNNVGSLAACGNGWYYDDPAAPTQVKLCPLTCTTVLNDSGTKVEVDLGCPGAYEPVEFTYQYYSDCPQGTKTQWAYFAYETLTPSTTSVLWKARTADTVADLANASYTTLATARALPDTQVCLMSGPTPCPIDLYQKFDVVDSRKSYLELSVTLNPAIDKSAAAKVNGWDLTYSCPPSD